MNKGTCSIYIILCRVGSVSLTAIPVFIIPRRPGGGYIKDPSSVLASLRLKFFGRIQNGTVGFEPTTFRFQVSRSTD